MQCQVGEVAMSSDVMRGSDLIVEAMILNVLTSRKIEYERKSIGKTLNPSALSHSFTHSAFHSISTYVLTGPEALVSEAIMKLRWWKGNDGEGRLNNMEKNEEY